VVTHPRFVWRILAGHGREAAGRLYYDADR